MAMSEKEREIRRELTSRKFLTPSEAAFVIFKSKATINRWILAGLKTYTDQHDGRRYVILSEVHDFKNDPKNHTRKRART